MEMRTWVQEKEESSTTPTPDDAPLPETKEGLWELAGGNWLRRSGSLLWTCQVQDTSWTYEWRCQVALGHEYETGHWSGPEINADD